MVRCRHRRSGFSLIELVISTVIVAIAIHAGSMIFKSAEYLGVKARIDERVASRVRFQSERMTYMPYTTLLTLAGTNTASGFLYQNSNGAGGFVTSFPYSTSSIVTVSGAGTATEAVTIATSIDWEEPSPDFTQVANIQKRLILASVTRRRF